MAVLDCLCASKVELFKGTIRSNLTLGLDQRVSDQELWQALEIAQAKDFVSEKERLLDALVEAGGRNFSGGQKQRLSIARAVLRQTPFLILDDATSALDTITESKLLKAIRENLPNTSLILISQRTSTLQMADKILLLEKGSSSYRQARGLDEIQSSLSRNQCIPTWKGGLA